MKFLTNHRNSNLYLFKRNLLYFKLRYKDNLKSKFYYDKFEYLNNESIIIFNKINFDKYYIINIIDFYGVNKMFNYHLNYLINKFSFNKIFIIQLFISSAKKNTIKNLVYNKFIKDDNFFNIIFTSSHKINKLESNFLKKSLITMSDTDVFIPLN